MSKTSVKSLIWTSIPATLSVALEPVAAMVDTALIGRLDTDWLAALAIATSVVTSLAWIFNFLVYAVTARVAQALGAGDLIRLGSQIKLALLTALICGVGVMVVLMVASDWILAVVMKAPPQLREPASSYLMVRAMGMPFVLLTTSLTGVLRGLQRIPAAMALAAMVTGANVIATYVLLYYMDFGLVGAAIGTTGSFVFGSLCGLVYLVFRHQETGFLAKFSLSIREALEFGGEALNLFVRTGCLTGAFFISTSVASRFGPSQVAAHQVALQVWFFASFFVDGLAVTATSFGGKLLGETAYDAWHILNRRLLVMGAVLGFVFAAVYLTAGGFVWRIFTKDPQVWYFLDGFWWLVALAQPLSALVYVFDGILFGSRDFKILRHGVVAGTVLVFLPVVGITYWWLRDMSGIWSALLALNAVRLGVAVFYYRRHWGPVAVAG